MQNLDIYDPLGVAQDKFMIFDLRLFLFIRVNQCKFMPQVSVSDKMQVEKTKPISCFVFRMWYIVCRVLEKQTQFMEFNGVDQCSFVVKVN